jgi:hypothetical protein
MLSIPVPMPFRPGRQWLVEVEKRFRYYPRQQFDAPARRKMLSTPITKLVRPAYAANAALLLVFLPCPLHAERTLQKLRKKLLAQVKNGSGRKGVLGDEFHCLSRAKQLTSPDSIAMRLNSELPCTD